MKALRSIKKKLNYPSLLNGSEKYTVRLRTMKALRSIKKKLNYPSLLNGSIKYKEK